jgi:hypothetical protein
VGTKTLFLIAGTKGGTGKSFFASNLAAFFRFRRKEAVRLFDLDPNPSGGLCRFYADCERLGSNALEGVGRSRKGLAVAGSDEEEGWNVPDRPRDLLGVVVPDNEYSVFIVDTASGCLPLVAEAFKHFKLHDRLFAGLQIVLVVVLTEEALPSLGNARPWLEFFPGRILVVYNMPRYWGNGVYGGGGRDAPWYHNPLAPYVGGNPEDPGRVWGLER